MRAVSYAIIVIVAFVASGLTLFSGFGLGTLLMPAFAIFFPVELAVAATAIVHFANSMFKIPLFARDANVTVVLRFGVPALLAALAGAWLLSVMGALAPIASYSIFGREAVISPIKLIMALLIFGFAMFELLPKFRELELDARWLSVGGVLSGFFGGLSGHQGALRAAFLAKCGLTPAQFVGTSAVIGFAVDAARLLVYGIAFFGPARALFSAGEHRSVLLAAIAAAFAGVLVGKRFVKKVTIRTIQLVSGALLIVVAAALASGVV
jgi:hypothetical protein